MTSSTLVYVDVDGTWARFAKHDPTFAEEFDDLDWVPMTDAERIRHFRVHGDPYVFDDLVRRCPQAAIAAMDADAAGGGPKPAAGGGGGGGGGGNEPAGFSDDERALLTDTERSSLPRWKRQQLVRERKASGGGGGGGGAAAAPKPRFEVDERQLYSLLTASELRTLPKWRKDALQKERADKQRRDAEIEARQAKVAAIAAADGVDDSPRAGSFSGEPAAGSGVGASALPNARELIYVEHGGQWARFIQGNAAWGQEYDARGRCFLEIDNITRIRTLMEAGTPATFETFCARVGAPIDDPALATEAAQRYVAPVGGAPVAVGGLNTSSSSAARKTSTGGGGGGGGSMSAHNSFTQAPAPSSAITAEQREWLSDKELKLPPWKRSMLVRERRDAERASRERAARAAKLPSGRAVPTSAPAAAATFAPTGAPPSRAADATYVADPEALVYVELNGVWARFSRDDNLFGQEFDVDERAWHDMTELPRMRRFREGGRPAKYAEFTAATGGAAGAAGAAPIVVKRTDVVVGDTGANAAAAGGAKESPAAAAAFQRDAARYLSAAERSLPKWKQVNLIRERHQDEIARQEEEARQAKLAEMAAPIADADLSPDTAGLPMWKRRMIEKERQDMARKNAEAARRAKKVANVAETAVFGGRLVAEGLAQRAGVDSVGALDAVATSDAALAPAARAEPHQAYVAPGGEPAAAAAEPAEAAADLELLTPAERELPRWKRKLLIKQRRDDALSGAERRRKEAKLAMLEANAAAGVSADAAVGGAGAGGAADDGIVKATVTKTPKGAELWKQHGDGGGGESKLVTLTSRFKRKNQPAPMMRGSYAGDPDALVYVNLNGVFARFDRDRSEWGEEWEPEKEMWIKILDPERMRLFRQGGTPMTYEAFLRQVAGIFDAPAAEPDDDPEALARDRAARARAAELEEQAMAERRAVLKRLDDEAAAREAGALAANKEESARKAREYEQLIREKGEAEARKARAHAEALVEAEEKARREHEREVARLQAQADAAREEAEAAAQAKVDAKRAAREAAERARAETEAKFELERLERQKARAKREAEAAAQREADEELLEMELARKEAERAEAAARADAEAKRARAAAAAKQMLVVEATMALAEERAMEEAQRKAELERLEAEKRAAEARIEAEKRLAKEQEEDERREREAAEREADRAERKRNLEERARKLEAETKAREEERERKRREKEVALARAEAEAKRAANDAAAERERARLIAETKAAEEAATAEKRKRLDRERKRREAEELAAKLADEEVRKIEAKRSERDADREEAERRAAAAVAAQEEKAKRAALDMAQQALVNEKKESARKQEDDLVHALAPQTVEQAEAATAKLLAANDDDDDDGGGGSDGDDDGGAGANGADAAAEAEAEAAAAAAAKKAKKAAKKEKKAAKKEKKAAAAAAAAPADDDDDDDAAGGGGDDAAAAAPASPAPAGEDPVDACAKCGERDKPLQQCGRCFKSYYCSRECQKKHWKAHKASCASS